jgi:hypothetical protein
MSQHVPVSHCLECGKSLDAATGADHDHKVTPGSLSLCVYCGALMIFGNDMRLRQITDAERFDIQADRHTMDLLRRASALIHFFRHSRN